MNNIGQILPVDGYFVNIKKALPVNYLQSLTHLYQPLIGPEALMLYQTLLNEIALQEESDPQTHHALMNYLTIPLDRIYESRMKLEGMGLLKTYKETNEEVTIYTYELQCPYDPQTFFQEAMFTTLLYHHIGEQRFRKLQNFYRSNQSNNPGENITVDFKDVFQTFKPNQELVNTTSEQNKEEDTIEEEFEWLEHMLKQRMIPVNRVLTKENRKLISQIRTVYDLENFEIDKAVLWALTDENYLDTQEFKLACLDTFKAKNNNKPIRLLEKKKVKQVEPTNMQPTTKEEILIQELELISPKQLLEDLSSGSFASETDMKLVSDVMTTQGLPAPVMNVLIYYCLIQTNNKLTRGYLETVAGQWSRAKLATAKEAMEFAKKEKASYEQSKTKTKQRQPASYQKSAANDIIPDWYKEGKHKQAKPQETKQQGMSKEQWKIANLIKQYSEGN